MSNKLKTIKKHLKTAREHVKEAGKVAKSANDSIGAGECREMEEKIGELHTKFSGRGGNENEKE